MSERPNPLPLLSRGRSNVLQAPLLFLMTAVCGTAALLVSVVDKSGRAQHRIARLWASIAVRVSLSKLTVEGAENFHKYPVAVYASNHTSYMDTPVIFTALPFQFRILAKKELWRMPFIGWYLQRSGQMPIDTANPHATLSSLGGALRRCAQGCRCSSFLRAGEPGPANCSPFSPERRTWRFARRCRWCPLR